MPLLVSCVNPPLQAQLLFVELEPLCAGQVEITEMNVISSDPLIFYAQLNIDGHRSSKIFSFVDIDQSITEFKQILKLCGAINENSLIA